MKSLRPRRYRLAAAVVVAGASLVGLTNHVTPARASCTFPTCVAPSSIGGGAVHVVINFSPDFPPLSQQQCSQIGFTFTATLAGAAVNTVGSQFAGTAPINGSGGNTCGLPSDELVGTTFNIAAFDDFFPILNLGSMEIKCANGLTGFYNRVGTAMLIEAGGSCNINQTVDTNLQFISVGTFTPGVPSSVPAPSNPVIPTGDQWQVTNGQISNGFYDGEWDFLLSN